MEFDKFTNISAASEEGEGSEVFREICLFSLRGRPYMTSDGRGEGGSANSE